MHLNLLVAASAAEKPCPLQDGLTMVRETALVTKQMGFSLLLLLSQLSPVPLLMLILTMNINMLRLYYHHQALFCKVTNGMKIQTQIHQLNFHFTFYNTFWLPKNIV
jgi:hypothetical protein